MNDCDSSRREAARQRLVKMVWRAHEGSEDATRELPRDLEPWVRAELRRYRMQPADEDDVCVDVVYACICGLTRIATRAGVCGWIAGVTHRQYRTWRRRERRTARVLLMPIDALADCDKGLVGDAARRAQASVEEYERIRALVREDVQRVLHLHFIDGLTIAEIASRIRLTRHQVEYRLSCGMKSVRRRSVH